MPRAVQAEQLSPRQVKVELALNAHRRAYCLVIVSSRFRIVLATIVQAASSRGRRADREPTRRR